MAVRERTARRLAWSIGAFSFACAMASLVLLIIDRRAFDSLANADFIDLVIPVGVGLIGALIASRRPGNPIGWLLLGIAGLAGLSGITTHIAIRSELINGRSAGLTRWAAWPQNWISIPIFPAGLLLFLFLLFPDGHLPSRRWRWLAGTGVAFSVVSTVLASLDASPIELTSKLRKVHGPIGFRAIGSFFNGAWGGFFWLGGLLLLFLSAWALVQRMRRSRGEERQQIKWFAYGAGGTVAVLAVAVVVSLILQSSADLPFTLTIAIGFGVVLPVSSGVAILRYGLYEIDVVINRTVVFGVLVAFITAVYVAIVVGIGTAIGSRANVGLSILATAVVAVAFQPIRDRARRFANRLVYGRRATPYEVLSSFAERMAATGSIDDVLPRTARALAEATGAVHADVWLRVGSELRPGAAWPPGRGAVGPAPLTDGQLPELPSATTVVAVRHEGELLGALSLEKAPGDPLTPAEDKLVSDVASQAGLVLRNVRLIEELRASRQRLVTAQDHERRRLERNIHDGAQQQLVALAVKIGLAEKLSDPGSTVRPLLSQLQEEVVQALEDLRDLARGIYPPLLADQGLGPALESQVRRGPVPVDLETEAVRRYPQEAEAAVYFCVLEALQNVAKYAAANRARVRIVEADGDLTFVVSDEGRGFDPARTTRGTGLQGMSDRLAALGGELTVRSSPGTGTTIVGRLPVAGAPEAP
jgi:signal transduction histidine kinase